MNLLGIFWPSGDDQPDDNSTPGHCPHDGTAVRENTFQGTLECEDGHTLYRPPML